MLVTMALGLFFDSCVGVYTIRVCDITAHSFASVLWAPWGGMTLEVATRWGNVASPIVPYLVCVCYGPVCRFIVESVGITCP